MVVRVSVDDMRALAVRLDSTDTQTRGDAIDQLVSLTGDVPYETGLAAIELCCAGLRRPSVFVNADSLQPLLSDVLPRILRKMGSYGGADLRRAELLNATFDECGLPGADFTGARFLGNTTFVKSQLDGARLVGCTASPETSFAAAQLAGAQLAGLIAEKANFTGADLKHADFTAAKLWRAHFNLAVAPGAVFVGSDLYGADLSGADLRGANLAGVRLDDAELNEGRNDCVTDLRGANLAGASFKGARLIRTDLRGANLAGANLEEAHAVFGVQLQGAILAGAKFSTGSVSF